MSRPIKRYNKFVQRERMKHPLGKEYEELNMRGKGIFMLGYTLAIEDVLKKIKKCKEYILDNGDDTEECFECGMPNGTYIKLEELKASLKNSQEKKDG